MKGFMQACYSLGATLSPLIATSMFTKYGMPWYSWYYVMTAAAGLELLLCSWAFWQKDGARYRRDNPRTTSEGGGRTKEAMKNKVTWMCAGFFFCVSASLPSRSHKYFMGGDYPESTLLLPLSGVTLTLHLTHAKRILQYVGAEVALGGWIVTFMNRIRLASAYNSGIAATGFWAGMTVGRAGLGFVTDRFGERICVLVYLAFSLGLELLFWFVPNFIVSAVAVAFLGMFLGPLFPAGVIVRTPIHSPESMQADMLL